MSTADICPETRQRCDLADVCRLLYCAKLGHVGISPISERELTKAERYSLHIAEQRQRDGSAG